MLPAMIVCVFLFTHYSLLKYLLAKEVDGAEGGVEIVACRLAGDPRLVARRSSHSARDRPMVGLPVAHERPAVAHVEVGRGGAIRHLSVGISTAVLLRYYVIPAPAQYISNT
jgi:hypothetical protein